MGGQRGDEGTVFINDHSLIITDVIKDSNGHFLHKIKKAEHQNQFSGKAIVSVNQNLRQDIQRHHTATHILHWALREVLGEHVKQAGSLVEQNRLRFDFSHFEALKDEQLFEIEAIANHKLSNEMVERMKCRFPKNLMKWWHSLVKSMETSYGWSIKDGVKNLRRNPCFLRRRNGSIR